MAQQPRDPNTILARYAEGPVQLEAALEDLTELGMVEPCDPLVRWGDLMGARVGDQVEKEAFLWSGSQ